MCVDPRSGVRRPAGRCPRRGQQWQEEDLGMWNCLAHYAPDGIQGGLG